MEATKADPKSSGACKQLQLHEVCTKGRDVRFMNNTYRLNVHASYSIGLPGSKGTKSTKGLILDYLVITPADRRVVDFSRPDLNLLAYMGKLSFARTSMRSGLTRYL